ncbi:serine O-acetyltransferase [Aliivibrio finisterrensis]|uniref:serine O-acetyltransferase n=1 Tax=Aliivibrio finisterrensis TaxID=511998 RepID=UPI00142ED0AB|nr:serine acetyltransferase [Aliivibrio finisterrensis]
MRYLTKRAPEKLLPIDIDIMYWFRNNRMFYLSKMWKNKIYYKYNVDISVQSQISSMVRFTHPVGIVIGDKAIIKDNVIILQGVTIGGSFNNGCEQIIEENVILCAGAKILGKVTIGKGAIIGANAVITKDVPENMVATGYNLLLSKAAKEYE